MNLKTERNLTIVQLQQSKITCNKCNRSISKANFDKHVCLSETNPNIKSIRNLYNDGLSLRKIIKEGFNEQYVKFVLKGCKRSPSEAGKLAHKKYPESFKLSEETKEILRQKRVAYLKQNTGTSAFQRRQNGKMSYGEQKLHDLFVKNDIYKKYDVVNEYCEHPYFLDFAFVNEKVDVEFDGHWHFTEKRQQFDKKRDKYLQQKGWSIYRITYYQLDNFNINELINFIGDAKNKYYKYDLVKYYEIKKQKHKEKKIKKLQQRVIINNKIDAQKNKKIQDKLQLLSTIDMTKFGWVEKASDLLNITHTSVRRFVNKHYKKEFFRRKK